MMTFDLDGESPWLHRDPARAERPLHMSMGAYGPKTGMPRILELLTYTPRRNPVRGQYLSYRLSRHWVGIMNASSDRFRNADSGMGSSPTNRGAGGQHR